MPPDAPGQPLAPYTPSAPAAPGQPLGASSPGTPAAPSPLIPQSSAMLLTISGVTNPTSMNATWAQIGTANGKPIFGPLDYVAGSAGNGTVARWDVTSTPCWIIHTVTNGVWVTGSSFASTSAVATPDLATGWVAQAGAAGSPALALSTVTPSSPASVAPAAPGNAPAAPGSALGSAPGNAPAAPGSVTPTAPGESVPAGAVRYTPQTLTAGEKAQALSNIGAATAAQGTKADGAVRFDEAQSLSNTQKTTSRDNIYSISRDEYIALLFSSLDPLVANYAVTESLAPAAALRLQLCVSELENAGILDELIDMAALRSGMVSSATAPKTLKGLTGATTGTPSLGATGLLFSGSQTAGWVTASPVDGFTLVADLEIQTGGANLGWIMGVENTAGYNTGAQHLRYLNTDSFLYESKEGATTTNATVVVDTGDSLYPCPKTRIPQILAITYDDAASPTLKSYANGVLLASDNSGNTQSTSTLDRVLFGMRHTTGTTYSSPFYGRVASWAMFNRELTATEIAAATKALRLLDTRRETIIIQGDSLSASIATAGSGPESWPYYLITSNTARDAAVRLVNTARSGTQSTYGATIWNERVKPWLPDARVAETGFFLAFYGTNDIYLGTDSAATIYARLVALCAAAKAASGPRIKTACWVIPPASAGTFSEAQEARRVALNVLIRAGSGTAFDILVDTEAIDVIGQHMTAWFYDGLHPNAYGKRIISQHVAAALPLNVAVPRNTALPVVAGTATVGSVLSATTGTWTNEPTSHGYQWTRDGADISAATAATYTLVAGDSGKRIACRVTATNTTGSAEMTSAQTMIS